MRLLGAFGIAAAASLLLTPASQAKRTPGPQPVELSYQPLMKPDGKHFDKIRVTLTFKGEADGSSEIELPSSWAGRDKFYERFSNYRVSGGQLQRTSQPDRLIISHKAGATITLSYDVTGIILPEKLGPQETANEYRAIIEPDYFHIIGETVVPRPSHVPGDALARFAIKGMPKGASFASDMQHGKNGLLQFDALVESIAVGGDFRILTAGKNARLAVRGSFEQRNDAQWVDAFRRVSDAVSTYWESDAGPYLVTVLPFKPNAPGSTSIGGTGRRDAFAFFATTNAMVDKIDQIMTHEMTHSWMPRRIGSLPDEEARQQEQYWLSEGFTDFATWRALVRAGIWRPEQYISEINVVLAEYDANSLRATPNLETAKQFWASRDGQRIAYLRGGLFGLLLDSELQALAKPSSLRTIFLAMQRQATRENIEGRSVVYLRKHAGAVGLPIDGLIAEHIDKGVPITFKTDFMAACAVLETRQQAKFDRGFDLPKSQANGNIFAGVVEGGNAWKAGLRNGMKLIGRSAGQIGNSQIEIAYDVEDGGHKRTLKWMPQSSEVETVRALRSDRLHEPQRRKACIAKLSR